MLAPVAPRTCGTRNTMPRDFGASSDQALPWPGGRRILQAMRIPRPHSCTRLMLLVLLIAAPAGAAAQRDRTVVGGQVGYARSWISTTSDSLNALSEDRQGASVGLFLRTTGVQVDLAAARDRPDDQGRHLPGRRRASRLEQHLRVWIPADSPAGAVRAEPERPRPGRPASRVRRGGRRASSSAATSPPRMPSTPSRSPVVTRPFAGWSGAGSWAAASSGTCKGVSLGLEARYMKAITSFIDSPLDPKNNLFAILLVLTI